MWEVVEVHLIRVVPLGKFSGKLLDQIKTWGVSIYLGVFVRTCPAGFLRPQMWLGMETLACSCVHLLCFASTLNSESCANYLKQN